MDVQDEDDEVTLMAVQTMETLHRHYNQHLNAYDVVGISVYRELNRRRAIAALENEITTDILMDMITQRLIAGTRNMLNDLSLHDDIRHDLTEILFETRAPELVKPPVVKCAQTVECSICLNPVESEGTIYDIPCKHVFHENCLSKWLERQQTCPLCRAKI